MEINNVMRLQLMGFKDKDRQIFESIFSLAENRLTVSWHMSTVADADFYLLPTYYREQDAIDKILQTLPAEQCIFCREGSEDAQANEILVDKSHIPYLRKLINSLNQLASQGYQLPITVSPVIPLNKEETQAPSEPLTNAVKIDDYFDPSLYPFIDRLHTIKEGILAFNFTPEVKLYIDFSNKAYCCTCRLERLQLYFSESDGELVQEASVNALNDFVLMHKLKMQPLSNLLWYSTLVCSQGRVLHEYQDSDVVRLRRWPDINLPGCQPLIKLAAYMQSNAVSLKVVQERTRFELADIYNFYNACHAVNLIEQCSQSDEHDKRQDETKLQLYKKISQRLNEST